MTKQDEQEILERKTRRQRILLLALLLLLPVLLFLVRLYWLQVMESDRFRADIQRQSIRTKLINPVRGEILDCNGEILAGNRAHYDLTLHPSAMRVQRGYLWTSTYMMNVATWLEENIFHRPGNLDIRTIRRKMKQDMSSPLVLYTDLTEAEMAQIAERLPAIPGLSITPRIERDYPHPGVASHLLGYCGWQWRQEGQGRRAFQEKDLLGNAGLERQYNAHLAGQIGVQTVLVDPVGFVRDVKAENAKKRDGHSIGLTLDWRIQQMAENALRGRDGALVCLDIHTGKVLAMASAPGYSLDTLAGEGYAALLSDKEHRPLFNRALHGTYMPGSIMKPLVALAALENGIVTQETVKNCPGYYLLGKRKIHCANRYGHGDVDLNQAITVSCNPYFIETGVACGMELLRKFYDAAGFGRKTGFDLWESTAGCIPGEDTAVKRYNRPWQLSDTAFVSMGQGAIEVTPLQAACYTAALANGGILWRPYVLECIYRNDGTLLQRMLPRQNGVLPVSRENLSIVQKAMESVVYGRGASAHILQRAPMRLAAKTGTAEVIKARGKTHNTWIICYGPVPNPTFAVACVIENGTSGSSTTAPIVLRFLQNAWPYLQKK